MPTPYEQLCAHLRAVATLDSVSRMLEWDQETQMPPKAAAGRAEQSSAVSALAHERRTAPKLGDLLAACESDASLKSDPAVAANLREIRRDYDRARKLPTELVAEISETNSKAMEAWKRARAASDFAAFRPWLEKQVALSTRKAECYGAPAGGELYDALLDEFEPGMTARQVEGVFGPLRAALSPFIEAIAGAKKRPDDSIDRVKIPLDKQAAFNKLVAGKVGYDYEAGVLAISTHPFSTNIGPGDVRMTTRYKDEQFLDAVSTTMHESGHSLYELGLPKDEYFGQPRAEAAGLGIHESQSRLWENHVGRSLPFWRWALPEAKRMFAPALDAFTPEHAWQAANVVQPGFIRVESDEATYHLHVMLRFDVERALIRRDMKVEDVPAFWNDRMKRDLGVAVPDDRRGCLQDVHWSMGAIGYFPTYTLGTLYAAQFWQTVRRDLPDLDARMERGEFAPLLDWLRKHVHALGRQYRAPDLCNRITGRELSHEPLMEHLSAKLRPLYSL